MFHMETIRLRQFCTIIEAGGLTRAARLLGISHSGLSKSVRTLENELGFELFRRVGRNIEPTERARTIYQDAKKIIKDVESLRSTSVSTNKYFRIVAMEVFLNQMVGVAIDAMGDVAQF